MTFSALLPHTQQSSRVLNGQRMVDIYVSLQTAAIWSCMQTEMTQQRCKNRVTGLVCWLEAAAGVETLLVACAHA